MLVPKKVFCITIIGKTLELVFIHLCPCQFLDLERSGRRGRIGGPREGNKSDFFVMGKDDMFFLLGAFGFFQPNLAVIHEDLGSNFILEATDKEFHK